MMEKTFEFDAINLLTDYEGNAQLICSISKAYKQTAQKAVSDAKERLKQGKKMCIGIEQTRKRRSIDANAYFHVLANKIAEAMRLGDEEVKQRLVLDYGTPIAVATFPKEAKAADYWSYAKYIGETTTGAQYMLYKPTHTLDSKEMARLIDGAVQEAKALGIETMTPRELAQLGGVNSGE
ncbi:MAG: hypothetical protein NC350_03910 [Corallococcus sp.]|nr:hypothetical protein [Corallococcus sp.]